MAGVAGCLGDGDGGTPTGTDTPAGGTGTTAPTGTPAGDTDTPTPTDTPPGDTDTPTPTPEPVPDDVAIQRTFADVEVTDSTLTVGTTTLTDNSSVSGIAILEPGTSPPG